MFLTLMSLEETRMSEDFIPHIVKPHPVTGVSNAKLAIWLFLASEVMLFGALFSTLVLLRINAVEWPESWNVLNVPLGAVNTLILIGSSVTMVMAYASIQLGKVSKFKMYLAVTVGLSLLFLVIKAFEYGAKFDHHIYPSTSTFFAIYFTMTGLHAIHILGGIVVNSYFLLPGFKLYAQEPERFTGRIECAGLYWHFVDLVWIFLFPALYLL